MATDSAILASYAGEHPPLVIYFDSIASDGNGYWAVWNNGYVPASAQDVIDADGAYISGSQAVSSAGQQPAIGPLGPIYGESVWYFVWSDGANSSIIYSGQVTGPVLLHSPRTDTVTPTGAKLYITANVDTDTTYWAVFSEPSAKLPADIITPTGAADSGNAPAQLTEDEFTATGLDTENQRYWVWYAHTDSAVAVSGVAFGGPAGGGGKGSLALNLTLVI